MFSPTEPLPDYAELFCFSNFSFLRGASHPHELVEQAHALGYRALALTDDGSVAGVVRALMAAEACGLHLIVGAHFRSEENLRLLLLAANRDAYAQLCALISKTRRRAEKGHYVLRNADLRHAVDHCLGIWLPFQHPEQIRETVWAEHALLQAALPRGLWLGVHFRCDGRDHLREQLAREAHAATALPIVACGDVRMHMPARLPLYHTLSAIRHHCTIDQLGAHRLANAEQHLQSRAHLAQRYPRAWLEESLRIAERCRFSLRELRYEYPAEVVPKGLDAGTHLRNLVMAGAKIRWPNGLRDDVRALIEKELKLIQFKQYEAYFLTVHDLVHFARSQKILCQGRGSAANSVVCYCLGITEVNPEKHDLLFERFISEERDEPPDIDVDFEHERREEVIQYIFRKYSRLRTAMTATVISYRLKSAIRDVGKALGIDSSTLDLLSHNTAWWDGRKNLPDTLRQIGLPPDSPHMQCFLVRLHEILDFPRHLSQHVGGFIIARGLLSELVPVENASMPERTVVQWNKDDIEYLGLMKVDVLSLGILSAIRKCRDLIRDFHGQELDMQDFAAHDEHVYQMLQNADAIGVFQVESRAQLSMLPRLRPRNFYDLVIEVAIVRPGPIQGGMVHPYLQRREHPEQVQYPSTALKPVLERTLGIPIFQEQVLKLAMVAANFTGGEADQLRRAMGAWQRKGGLEKHEEKLIKGMRKNGYADEFIQQICQQIRGFGEYGFPESHAASFALLAYVSAWQKCHYPAAYCAALINSQPMGFYSPSQLIQDAQRHDIEIRSVDVLFSEWDCTLERNNSPQGAIRLGLRLVKGLSKEVSEQLVFARQQLQKKTASFDWQTLTQTAGIAATEGLLLSRAGALHSLCGDRHQAHWQTLALEHTDPLATRVNEHDTLLPEASEQQNLLQDYRFLGLSLERHPLAHLRTHPALKDSIPAAQLPTLPDQHYVVVTGLVTNRQRPGTASGVLFMTLEDETGNANIVLWKHTQNKFRRALLDSSLLRIEGRVENKNNVTHVIAYHLSDLSSFVGELEFSSRNFH